MNLQNTSTVTKVEAECKACSGTGIYRGLAESNTEGLGVVCLQCKGTGKAIIEYIPFTERKKRDDIATIRRSRGTLVAFGCGHTGDQITYQEFLAGKMP